MSDHSQGPGWWQATDGRFYPPEDHPWRPSDPSSTSTSFEPTKDWWTRNRGLLLGLLGAVVILGLVVVREASRPDDAPSTSTPTRAVTSTCEPADSGDVAAIERALAPATSLRNGHSETHDGHRFVVGEVVDDTGAPLTPFEAWVVVEGQLTALTSGARFHSSLPDTAGEIPLERLQATLGAHPYAIADAVSECASSSVEGG